MTPDEHLMVRAICAGVVLVFIAADLLSMKWGNGSLTMKPFRLVMRWRAVRFANKEKAALPPDLDYGRVRERDPAVRMSTVHDRKTEEQYEQIFESRSPDGDGQRLSNALIQGQVDPPRPVGGGPSAEPFGESAGVVTALQGDGRLHGAPTRKSAAGSEPADSHTNLVPFERGYAFTGFSKRVH